MSKHSEIREERLDRRAFVQPPNESVRIERNWHAIAARTSSRSRASRFSLAGLGMAVMAAAAVAIWFGLPARSVLQPTAGSVIESGDEPSRMTLADGSEIKGAPRSRFELLSTAPTEVEFAVHRGTALFDVAKNNKRRFIVHAGGVSIEVKGTRFSVARGEASEASSVEVIVDRGVVQVTQGDQQRVLRAGQRWKVAEQVTTTTPAPTVTAAQTTPQEPQEAPAAANSTTSQVARQVPVVPQLTAVSLFEKAAAARVEGQHANAADLYERFLKRFPNDRRAPLVALELGRTRMDVLDEPLGAISSLRQALRLSPRSPFREDILARLTHLFDSQGMMAACRKSRSEYISAFPSGAHTSEIKALCPQ